MEGVSKDFSHGSNLKLGKLVIIEPDVVVGDNVKIGHRATLKSGTRICSNSTIDDHCITTGACFIGNNVNIRTGAIISRATIIEDDCFIGPGVITNHTKNVAHARENQIETVELLTYISYGSIIGSQVSLLAGVFIGPQSIIGGGSVVVKDIPGYGVYVGNPCHKLSSLPSNYLIDSPPTGRMYFNPEIMGVLKKYNKKLR